MKKSKITISIIIFFIVVAAVIGGRTGMQIYFKKKFGNQKAPGILVESVSKKNFSQEINSFCTSLPTQTKSFKISKSELLEPINSGLKVKKGEIIAKLSSKNIVAPFSGKIGTRTSLIANS